MQQYDDVIKETLQIILNVQLTDAAFNQATLPVSSGGLGIRLATDLALPAFLSSVAASCGTVQQLLPPRFMNSGESNCSWYRSAQVKWQSLSSKPLPESHLTGVQKVWDSALITAKFQAVMSAAQTQADRARLIAASSLHAGEFLNAIPNSAIGTRLDNTSLRIAVSLRLGTNICSPHTCVCGEPVDALGTHGLACRKSAGRHYRHNAVNDLIKRALASAEIPAMLEPSSLTRSDGKRPDGLTVQPWSRGRCLVWDFTCPDTLAPSHLNRAVLGPGTVAIDAESKKLSKYTALSPLYHFMPVAIETLGAVGTSALTFFRDIGRRIATVTSEPRSFTFLMQRLSVAIQRGNAVCITGTIKASDKLDELFVI